MAYYNASTGKIVSESRTKSTTPTTTTTTPKTSTTTSLSSNDTRNVSTSYAQKTGQATTATVSPRIQGTSGQYPAGMTQQQIENIITQKDPNIIVKSDSTQSVQQKVSAQTGLPLGTAQNGLPTLGGVQWVQKGTPAGIDLGGGAYTGGVAENIALGRVSASGGIPKEYVSPKQQAQQEIQGTPGQYPIQRTPEQIQSLKQQEEFLKQAPLGYTQSTGGFSYYQQKEMKNVINVPFTNTQLPYFGTTKVGVGGEGSSTITTAGFSYYNPETQQSGFGRVTSNKMTLNEPTNYVNVEYQKSKNESILPNISGTFGTVLNIISPRFKEQASNVTQTTQSILTAPLPTGINQIIPNGASFKEGVKESFGLYQAPQQTNLTSAEQTGILLGKGATTFAIGTAVGLASSPVFGALEYTYPKATTAISSLFIAGTAKEASTQIGQAYVTKNYAQAGENLFLMSTSLAGFGVGGSLYSGKYYTPRFEPIGEFSSKPLPPNLKISRGGISNDEIAMMFQRLGREPYQATGFGLGEPTAVFKGQVKIGEQIVPAEFSQFGTGSERIKFSYGKSKYEYLFSPDGSTTISKFLKGYKAPTSKNLINPIENLILSNKDILSSYLPGTKSKVLNFNQKGTPLKFNVDYELLGINKGEILQTRPLNQQNILQTSQRQDSFSNVFGKSENFLLSGSKKETIKQDTLSIAGDIFGKTKSSTIIEGDNNIILNTIKEFRFKQQLNLGEKTTAPELISKNTEFLKLMSEPSPSTKQNIVLQKDFSLIQQPGVFKTTESYSKSDINFFIERQVKPSAVAQQISKKGNIFLISELESMPLSKVSSASEQFQFSKVSTSLEPIAKANSISKLTLGFTPELKPTAMPKTEFSLFPIQQPKITQPAGSSYTTLNIFSQPTTTKPSTTNVFTPTFEYTPIQKVQQQPTQVSLAQSQLLPSPLITPGITTTTRTPESGITTKPPQPKFPSIPNFEMMGMAKKAKPNETKKKSRKRDYVPSLYGLLSSQRIKEKPTKGFGLGMFETRLRVEEKYKKFKIPAKIK